MKTRQLINQTLTKQELAQMKSLTTSNIAFKALQIFGKHIGSENSISRPVLFRKIFGRPEEVSLRDDLRWDYVKKAMHLCRQRTKCFIGSFYHRGLWRYFVVSNRIDAQYYIDNLEKNIKRMRVMQKKVIKSVELKWHKLDWLEDVKERKALGYSGGQLDVKARR